MYVLWITKKELWKWILECKELHAQPQWWDASLCVNLFVIILTVPFFFLGCYFCENAYRHRRFCMFVQILHWRKVLTSLRMWVETSHKPKQTQMQVTHCKYLCQESVICHQGFVEIGAPPAPNWVNGRVWVFTSLSWFCTVLSADALPHLRCWIIELLSLHPSREKYSPPAVSTLDSTSPVVSWKIYFMADSKKSF